MQILKCGHANVFCVNVDISHAYAKVLDFFSATSEPDTSQVANTISKNTTKRDMRCDFKLTH